MEINISSKLNAKELYHFLLYQTYSSVWGFTGILISICALTAYIRMTFNHADAFSRICLLTAAILFLVIQPVRLYLQTQRLIESDSGYQKPIDYTFSNRGIELRQGDLSVFHAWEKVHKIIRTKKILAIYIGKTKVLKLADRDISGQYEELKELIQLRAVHAIKKMK